MSGYLSARAVNGDGPTCGCGAHSSLHILQTSNALRDYFLCASCAMAAVERYLHQKQQEPQGPPPGDYMTKLYSREHAKGYHDTRRQRWCPECEAAA